jgi:hypothetical protein
MTTPSFTPACDVAYKNMSSQESPNDYLICGKCTKQQQQRKKREPWFKMERENNEIDVITNDDKLFWFRMRNSINVEKNNNVGRRHGITSLFKYGKRKSELPPLVQKYRSIGIQQICLIEIIYIIHKLTFLSIKKKKQDSKKVP